MWEKKTSNIRDNIGVVNKKIQSVALEKVELDNFSCQGLEFDRIQSDSKTNTETECGSFHTIIEQLMKLTQIVEQNNRDITLRQKIMEEEMKSLKVDLKSCLEIQKDIVKSYLIMKKDNSAIKGQVEMAYGKKFFQ